MADDRIIIQPDPAWEDTSDFQTGFLVVDPSIKPGTAFLVSYERIIARYVTPFDRPLKCFPHIRPRGQT